MINASNNRNKANKQWQEKPHFKGIDTHTHNTSYQQIDSVTQAINRHKRSKAFSYPNEGHKGPKV